ncbi:polysaccharide deacetylase family protein [Salinimicrobium sp. 3283s]|uniref:polysaccharide deacetylase family protein n=1 Tax=Salinimicrobium sp. 3283s TaxID=3114359 RepID=UPI0031EB6A0F
MLIVANYHYIREDFSAAYPSIFGLTSQQFQKQLEQLSKFGSFISQEDLVSYPTRASEKNFFLITFDDGLKEQYELAKPVLEEMGIPYISFINTSNFSDNKVSLVHKIHLLRSHIAPGELLQQLVLETLSEKEIMAAVKHYNYDSKENALLKYLLNFKLSIQQQESFVEPLFAEIFEEEKVAEELYFTEEMLQELHKKGVLGSHSHRHLPLGRLQPSEVKKEMHKTQAFFLARFGKKASTISYPYGSRDSCEGIQEIVQKAGFELGFSMERAANASLDEDSLLLARYDCNDLPGGKNNLFGNEDPFKLAALRQWHI